jgi:hypothetical protein
VDEAHMLFDDPVLRGLFLKSALPLLFFTTTSEASVNGKIQYTPEINETLYWSGEFDLDGLQEEIDSSSIGLSREAVVALAHISTFHRGLFSNLCGKWVYPAQIEQIHVNLWFALSVVCDLCVAL